MVEEVPAATAPAEEAAALPEEPALEKIEGGLKGVPDGATFHPSKSAPAPTGEGFSANGRYVVQVSVYKSRSQAERLKEKLVASGYPAYVADVQDPTPDLAGTYHRVRIGNFASLIGARDFGENTLRSQGFEYWVDKKANDHRALAPSESFSEPSYQPQTSFPSQPAAPAEPVGVPEPPAPSEPLPPQDNNWGNPASEPSPPADDSWGNPLNETPSGSGSSGSGLPSAPKDDPGSSIDGW